MGKKAIVRRKYTKPCERVQKPKAPQYRATVVSMVSLINEITLKKEHINELKKTPFWNLFKAFINGRVLHERKFDRVSERIIRLYDEENKRFPIGRYLIPLYASDISLIFGIISGKEKIDLKYYSKRVTPFVRRRFMHVDRLDGKNIRDALLIALEGTTVDDFQDVARLLCLYLFLSLLFATSGFTIKWGFVKYVENIDEMVNYAWTEAMASALMGTIETSNGNPARVSGCVITLQYWFCEHTTILTSTTKHDVPRFLKWNLIELNKKLKDLEIRNFSDNEIHPRPLKLTPKERKIYGHLIPKYLQILEDDSEESKNPTASSSGTDGDDEASGPAISHSSTDNNDGIEEESDEDDDARSVTSQEDEPDTDNQEQSEQEEKQEVDEDKKQATDEDGETSATTQDSEEQHDVISQSDEEVNENESPKENNQNFFPTVQESDDKTTAEKDIDFEKFAYSPIRNTSSYSAAVNERNETFHLDELELVDCFVSPDIALRSLSHDMHCKSTPPTPFGTAKIGTESSNEEKQKERNVIKDLQLEIQQLIRAQVDADTVMNDLKSTIESLKMKVDNLESENQKISKAKITSDQIIVEMKREKSLLEIQTNHKDSTIKLLEDVVKIREEEIEDLKKKINEYDIQVGKQQESGTERSSENSPYVKFLLEQYERVKERESKTKTDLAKQVTEKEAQINSLMQKLQSLEEENEKLDEQLMIDQADKIETQMHQAVIVSLRSEVEALTEELTKQKEKVISDEDNIQEPEKKNEEEIHKVDRKANEKKIDSGKKKRKRAEISIQEQWERSLVRDIKLKIRKPKRMKGFQYTPEKAKTEGKKIIHGQENTPIDVEELETPQKNFVIPTSKEFPVYHFLQEKDQQLLHKINEKERASATVFQVKDQQDFITLADLVSLIREELLGNNIIDAYAHLLMEWQTNKTIVQNENEKSGKSKVMSSLCLQWIREKDKKALKEYIDPYISDKKNQDRYRHYPLHSKGYHKIPNHWTLAVADTEDRVWRFYNSLRPRKTKGKRDPYKRDFNELKYYIDSYWKSKNQEGITEVEEMKEAPQQHSGTVDCGVIICYIMKQIFLNDDLAKNCNTQSFRAEMISDFLNCPDSSWNEDDYNKRAELRKQFLQE